MQDGHGLTRVSADRIQRKTPSALASCQSILPFDEADVASARSISWLSL